MSKVKMPFPLILQYYSKHNTKPLAAHLLKGIKPSSAKLLLKPAEPYLQQRWTPGSIQTFSKTHALP